ncbi:MAG: site-2 protease family protein [Armatimonadetes bacterium]|nr:site-2 protease family protein [Armatimonadota bacterium]
MADDPPPGPVVACPECGTQVAPTRLDCPNCRWLVHGETLKALAAGAEQAASGNDLPAALIAWERALLLLPPDSRQYGVVSARAQELRRRIEADPAQAKAARRGSGWQGGAAGVSGIALVLWKLKALLLGLTKGATLFSMLLSFGVYWTAWGWRFALGLVLSIYVHEMGHVLALRRYGIAATAPMFIPGFGAMIRLRERVTDPVAEARIGLAGPSYGLGAAVVCWIVALATGSPYWLAVAKVGAWINLFNLLPVWQLDGARGLRSLTRNQRWLLVLAAAALGCATTEGLLVLMVLLRLVQAGAQAADEPDRAGLVEFLVLLAALAGLAAYGGHPLPAATGGGP